MNPLRYQFHRASFIFHNHSQSPNFISSTCVCMISTLSVTNLIQHHIRNGNINDARQLFDQNPTSCDTVTWNSMITGYIKNNQMQGAHNLFDQMPVRDVVSWNTMMSGLNKTKDPHKLYQLFLQMIRAGVIPNQFTFSTVISGFMNAFDVLVPQLHVLIVHLGLHSNVFVGSALMRGYTCLKDSEALHRVFDDVVVKDVSTWNALVVGYMELGFTVEAQVAFDNMPVVNIISWTTLVNGYIKNRKIDRARSIFDNMPYKNVVTWTAMIKGYVQYDNHVDAIHLFILMLKSGTRPNHFTYSTLLDACAGCSTFLLGNQLHSCILKSGLDREVVVSTALVDMYMKCGDLEVALCVFECMATKNTVSWNSVIGGCARHGLANRALCEFEKMIESGAKPDGVTYVNLLSACVHGGLVKEGERHFNSMGVRYGVKAEMKHYSCMVDLYGKSGELEKAEKLVKDMPFEPDVGVWGALLSACGLHSRYELANGLENLAHDYPTIYSMLVKLHGEKGEWSRAVEMRNKMMEIGARKQKASSRTD
ncbi:putative tetratricopeptide-like helical domain superfamily [Helianthus annuus]|nr:putative tetratricopeptide-like helical domain superfamily [Helianthus annuus]KAJ0696840.1 putative tetratricopeptide-like helical domain superfamily [Helianthus annuus]KAJ0879583.1 putative tetratricopeptide-like helical domain superfamily [Helianthus annuus]